MAAAGDAAVDGSGGGGGVEDGGERAEAGCRGGEGCELAEEGAELEVDGGLQGGGWGLGEEVEGCNVVGVDDWRAVDGERGVGEGGCLGVAEEGWEEVE